MLPKKIFGATPWVKNEDLHPSHFHVLHIVEHGSSIQMADISNKLGITKSNLTPPLIQKLIEKNYIYKTKDERDRRVTYIDLTEKGKQFSKENKAVLYKKVRDRFAVLSPEDKNDLNDAFTKINLILSNIED